MNAIETGKRGPTQQIYHRVVEPSLGNLKLDFYPHHHNVRLHTAFYPQQNHCQLESESLESLPRPLSHPLTIRQHGMLPKIAEKKANITKRSPSRSGSVGSVSQTKELPLLTSHSQDRGSHLLPRNTKKALSVCSQYRYLGPSKALQSQSIGSSDEEALKSEQVRRFEEEVKTLEHTRHLKRVSEIATYQHRVDRMYYMCGSKVPLHGKYNVDNEELEKLRAFSIARSQSRASSGRRSATGGRIRDNRSSFASGTDNQTDPRLTIDIVTGTVTKSPGSDWFGKELDAGEDEGATGADGDVGNGSREGDNAAHVKSPGGEGDTHGAAAAVVSAETFAAFQGEGPAGDSGHGHKTFVTEETSGETPRSNERSVGDAACGHEAFNTEEKSGETLGSNERHVGNDIHGHESSVTGENSKETDLPQKDGDYNHPNTASPSQQYPDTGVEASGKEEQPSTGKPTSSEMQESSERMEDESRTRGDGENEDVGDGEQSRGSHSHSDYEDGDDDGEGNADSARDCDEVAEESAGAADQSISEGSTSEGVPNPNHQELGFGIVLDRTPYHATNKQIYNNTTFDNPLLKQFEDLATLSKGDEDGLYQTAYQSEQSRHDGRDSFLSNQRNDVTAQEEGEDALSDKLSRVGHLEDAALDEDVLHEQAGDATNWDNGVFGKVLNDEELKKKEEMKEKRQREKEAAKQRQNKKPVKEETPAVPSPRKINLTDIYSFITTRQKMIFQKKFQELDVDHNGKITLKELTQRMNKEAKKEELKEFMRVFDLNKDKTIDEREFVTVAALNDKLRGQEIQSEKSCLQLNLSKLALHVTAYKEIFEMTDQDSNGYLNLEEVMFIISVSVGTEIGTDKEILDYIFKNLDINGNGTIDFVEFLSFIPFFLKLHQEIVGRPATVEDVVKANAAIKEALSKKR